MFHDEVTVQIQAGRGGDGSISFRREKYVPRGGPDGGDGGNGGDVYIVATRQLSDLNFYSSTHHFAAESGIPGAGQKLYGKAGEDLTLRVPVGTRIYRMIGENRRLVVDMVRENDPFRLLLGGKGGLGNVHFATATNQAPRKAEPGEPGQKGTFTFELQLIADIGVIGLPNAGKSTFLSIVTDAKPKIANYPFTTLSPVLGVAHVDDSSFIIADIPGLIEGASDGKGLGHQFLRHVRRTKVLLHLIDALSDDYARDYLTVRKELEQFDIELANKTEIVAISKTELLHEGFDEEKMQALQNAITSPSQLFESKGVSAVTGDGIQQLLRKLRELTQEE